MTLTEEEAKRRKALEYQAMLTAKQAADGNGSRTEAAEGEKNREKSAAARAPEAPQGQGAFRSPPETPSGREKVGNGETVIPANRRTKPNRRENEFMMNLMILRNTLRTNAPSCRERARLAGKWIWRDIRLMLTLVDRIQTAMMRTMPEGRDDYYTAYAMHGHYELHMDGPVRTPRHVLISDRNLAAMAEAAMESECILCMREGNEIDRCMLREALLEVAAPTEVQADDGRIRKCEYRDAAGALVHGTEVTV